MEIVLYIALQSLLLKFVICVVGCQTLFFAPKSIPPLPVQVNFAVCSPPPSTYYYLIKLSVHWFPMCTILYLFSGPQDSVGLVPQRLKIPVLERHVWVPNWLVHARRKIAFSTQKEGAEGQSATEELKVFKKKWQMWRKQAIHHTHRERL